MNEMNETEMFERNKEIQAMVNAFCTENHMPTITEMLAKSGKKEILGVLTPNHKIVLQQMIRHEYPDIDDQIRKTRNSSDGRGQILGVLSTTEASLVDGLLINYQTNKMVEPEVLEQTIKH